MRLLVACLALAAHSATATDGFLDSTSRARRLPSDEAARNLPVRLEGVVTFRDFDLQTGLILHDPSGGIYVRVSEYLDSLPLSARGRLRNDLVPGKRIRVVGYTRPGKFAPIISPSEVDILGSAPLPPARPVDLPELLSGRQDCQRVEISGVVQSARTDDDTSAADHALEIATEAGNFIAKIRTEDAPSPASLVDARIRIRGVCLPFFNTRDELVGVRVMIANPDDLEILDPADPDPFSAPLVPLDRLRPFSPEGHPLHRLHVRGTVNFRGADKSLFLQHESDAIRIRTAETLFLEPGDRIEASGFLDTPDNHAELREAVVRKIASGPPLDPIPVTPLGILGDPALQDHAIRKDYDCRLISIEATLAGVETTLDGDIRLLSQADGHTFSSQLGTSSAAGFDPPPVGSRILLTGVCHCRYGLSRPFLNHPRVRDFTLLLRSPADLAIIDPAPWWTPARLRVALAAVLAALALTYLWVRVLKKQVAVRGAELAGQIRARHDAEVEFKAILSERSRMAADLHDTLEQSLTGLALQLEASADLHGIDSAKSAHHFRLARSLLHRSREDVRRSIWNLRARELDGRSLPEALADTVTALDGHAARIGIDVTGTERPLPEFVSGNLLLLAGEALTNALKHANASRIDLRLHFDPSSVTLEVADDGNGFDPATAPGPTAGHFGLQGMRERLKRLGGSLQIDSAPGRGTRLTSTIPTEHQDPP